MDTSTGFALQVTNCISFYLQSDTTYSDAMLDNVGPFVVRPLSIPWSYLEN